MVFNDSSVSLGILLGIIVWLSIVSALLIRMINHYNRIGGIGKAGLRDVLETIVGAVSRVERKTNDVDKLTDSLASLGERHLQRIGIVRFNPFADTGGAQSFSIAFLDGKDNGIVMTSLYARSGNRWYVKEVVAGKGKELALSKEEESAIEKAKHTGRTYE